MPRLSNPLKTIPNTTIKAGIITLATLTAAYIGLGFAGPRAQRVNGLEDKFEHVARNGNPTIVATGHGKILNYKGQLRQILRQRDQERRGSIGLGGVLDWYASEIDGNGEYEVRVQTPTTFYPNPF